VLDCRIKNIYEDFQLKYSGSKPRYLADIYLKGIRYFMTETNLNAGRAIA
jgi:hypothetical protein